MIELSKNIAYMISIYQFSVILWSITYYEFYVHMSWVLKKKVVFLGHWIRHFIYVTVCFQFQSGFASRILIQYTILMIQLHCASTSLLIQNDLWNLCIFCMHSTSFILLKLILFPFIHIFYPSLYLYLYIKIQLHFACEFCIMPYLL